MKELKAPSKFMFREKCRVEENKKIAPKHYVMKIVSPRIAGSAKPGQFVQIMCSDHNDPLLPRPFSFLTADKKSFSVLYQVVGKGTDLLSQIKKDARLWVMGPLGNGFATGSKGSDPSDPVLVGGGVGIPPLYHWAEQHVRRSKIFQKKIHVFLGARNKSLLLCEKDFKKLGVDLHLATDDGSKGDKGFITKSVENFINSKQKSANLKILTCGPTPMLKAVSALANKNKINCEVSVEVPMACGFGACLGCAIRVRGRYAIACCEGPVFQAADIGWEESV